MNVKAKLQIWKFMEIITETGCSRIISPNQYPVLFFWNYYFAAYLLCVCFFWIDIVFVHVYYILPLSVLPSFLVDHHFSLDDLQALVSDNENCCVNCENKKTPGQLLFYLRFQFMTFCPVCFYLLKMHEQAVQQRLFSLEEHCLSEKLKRFLLHWFVEPGAKWQIVFLVL